MLAFDALGRLALGELSVSTASSITAEVGTFTLTGLSANFTVAATLDVGVVVVIGQDAVSTASMPAGTGAFALSGQDAALRAAYTILCEPYIAPNRVQWGFSALGEVALGQMETTSGASVTFSISGQDIQASASVLAEAGSFTVTGGAASLIEGNVLTAECGTFVLTWPTVSAVVTLPLGSGSFVVSGITATELARASIKIRRFPRVGGTTVSARSMGAGMRTRAYGG